MASDEKIMSFQFSDPDMVIIQAIEKCIEGNQNCAGCVYNVEHNCCMKKLLEDVLDLINRRQKAALFQADTLHGIINHCTQESRYWEEKYRAGIDKLMPQTEAIKKFVERFKYEANVVVETWKGIEYPNAAKYVIPKSKFDNLAKEWMLAQQKEEE